MKLILDTPINNLSFGNVSVNLIRELFKREVNLSIFENGPTEMRSFDKLSEEFKAGVSNACKYKYFNLENDVPTLKLWHINESEKRITRNQFLFTFYELDSPTFVEKKILELQNHTFLSNPEAVELFKKGGVENISYVPLGFDPDLKVIEEKAVPDKIHFILMGKLEKRKRTKEIIQLWLKKYGNDKKYLLSCLITNPFIPAKDLAAMVGGIAEGKHYNNLNYVPFLPTNTEMNNFINSADIDLTGLSGAEGWNIPSFNATALGKWSIVNNHTGHTAWANKENSLLVQPKDKIDSTDGMFFAKGLPFNQGNINTFDDDEVIAAMELGVKKAEAKEVNKKGLELQEKFTYSRTVDEILKVINK